MKNEKSVALKKITSLRGTPVQWPRHDIDTVKKALIQLFDWLDIPLQSFRNANVLLHPNLVRPDPGKIPASFTDPRVILALSEILIDAGARKVQVGENPGFGFPADDAFRLAGLKDPLKKLGVEVLCFDEQEWAGIPNPRGRLFKRINVSKAVLETDYFINIPKWKTHMLTNVSLCIKNLLGIIHDDDRMLFHRNDIIEKIVDLLFVRKPDLNIVDGLWAMEGQAPFHGKAVRNFNALAAGTDAVAVDSVVSELMGFRRMEIPHVVLARKRHWGTQEIVIATVGDPPESIQYHFQRPVLSSAGWFEQIHCIECGVCNGCLSAIRHSLDKLMFEDKLRSVPEVTIVSGMPMPNQVTLESWDGSLILFGNCASRFQFYTLQNRSNARWIQGCPPHVMDLEKFLLKLID